MHEEGKEDMDSTIQQNKEELATAPETPLELYTLKQSVQRLGNMTPTEFYRIVQREGIRTVTPMGKKSKLYSKEDVERIAAAIEEFHRKYRLAED